MYYLGSITGASGGYNNQSAGNSGIGTFIIPQQTKSLFLVPSASGLLFEFFSATGSTGSTFNTTLARGAQLEGPALISGPFHCLHNSGQHTVISIFHNQAGFISCRVYATLGD